MNDSRGGTYASGAGFALSAAILLTVSACSEGGDPAQSDVPVFEGSVDLEIGELVGDDPYLFTSIGSVVADQDGRVIVADMRTSEIRVFDSDGRFAFRFGGPGEGPGELTDPCCMAFGPDGALWVREGARYSVFRLDSASARYDSGRISLHAGSGNMGPVTFDAEGRLVDIGSFPTPGDKFVTARLREVSDGVVDTVLLADADRQHAGRVLVPFTVEGFQGVFYVFQPFGPTWIHGHAPGGAWAEAVTSEYSINFHDADGNVSRMDGPQLPGPALSPAERSSAQARMDRDVERRNLGSHPFDMPDRKPPLARIFFDRDGRLWVAKTNADGEEMREADVYDGGALVARYRWPVRVRTGAPWVTESTLYGTTRDTLDVQRVARVRFEPKS